MLYCILMIIAILASALAVQGPHSRIAKMSAEVVDDNPYSQAHGIAAHGHSAGLRKDTGEDGEAVVVLLLQLLHEIPSKLS